jgi:hypothetical protein
MEILCGNRRARKLVSASRDSPRSTLRKIYRVGVACQSLPGLSLSCFSSVFDVSRIAPTILVISKRVYVRASSRRVVIESAVQVPPQITDPTDFGSFSHRFSLCARLDVDDSTQTVTPTTKPASVQLIFRPTSRKLLRDKVEQETLLN